MPGWYVSLVSTICRYNIAQLIIRPHLTAMWMRPIVTDEVVWSVCLSVWHNLEPCKNSWTDRDAVWNVDSGWPKEPHIRRGSRSPMRWGQFWLGNVVICTADGWLKEQNQQFFYNGIRALEKLQTKCILVAGNYVEAWQTSRTYLLINYVSLWTFWTPLVC